MKTLLSTLILFISINSSAQGLKEALNQKLIEVEFLGAGNYHGKSIMLKIKNLTSRQLTIEMQPGQYLQPEDSTMQRMLVADDSKFIIAANKSRTSLINAFCSQSRNHAPDSLAKFKIGLMAPKKIIELAQIIAKNKFTSMAAQNAVWCLTDDADLYSINGENQNEETILRTFISKAKNQPLNVVLKKQNAIQPQQTPIKHVYVDSVKFVIRESCLVSLVLYDTLGNELLTFIKPTKIKPNTNVHFNYRLTYSGLDYGKVIVKARKDNGDLIYEKDIIILE